MVFLGFVDPNRRSEANLRRAGLIGIMLHTITFLALKKTWTIAKDRKPKKTEGKC